MRCVLTDFLYLNISFFQENDCYIGNRVQVKNAHIKKIEDGGQLPRSISHNFLNNQNPDSSPNPGHRHFANNLPIGTLAESPQISRASNIALRTNSTR